MLFLPTQVGLLLGLVTGAWFSGRGDRRYSTVYQQHYGGTDIWIETTWPRDLLRRSGCWCRSLMDEPGVEGKNMHA